MKIGIDFGVTKTKVIGLSESGTAYLFECDSKPITREFVGQCMKKVTNTATEETITDIAVTGTKSSHLPDTFEDIPIIKVIEWEAIIQGAHTLYTEEDYLLVHMGSGTSFFLLTADTSKRIGGTGLGGGIIDSFRDYFDIKETLNSPKLSEVHSSVHELVGNIEGLRDEWPGVYFQKLNGATEQKDIVFGMEQVVADEIMNHAYTYMKATMLVNVAFSGGLTHNAHISSRISYWVNEFNLEQISHSMFRYVSLIGLVGMPHTIKFV